MPFLFLSFGSGVTLEDAVSLLLRCSSQVHCGPLSHNGQAPRVAVEFGFELVQGQG